MSSDPLAEEATPGLPVRRFSTAGLPSHQRHEAWANQGWPSLARALDAEAEPGFDAESETLTVGPLTIIYGRYGAQTVHRTPDRIARAPAEHLNVCLLVSGTMAGTWGSLVPGEVALADLTTPWSHRSSAGALVSFTVPRPLAYEHGLDPRALHGTVIGAPEAALLASHLHQVRRSAALVAPADAPRLAGTVIDLVTVALGARGRAGPPPPSATAQAVKRRAERLIAAGIGDRKLDAAYLARAIGVSRATLYRLFEPDGGVQRRIRQARLEAAAAALTDPDAVVGDLAERFGFSDLGHFSRAFREAFGVPPSDYRAGVRAEATGAGTSPVR